MTVGTDPKLRLFVVADQARHFLRWELPILDRHFRLTDAPEPGALLYAFGPDVLEEAARMPAASRFVSLFPGFDRNPYHDLEYRRRAREVLEAEYARVFVNPGPLEIAYAGLGNLDVVDFSIDTRRVGLRGFRRRLDSLLHVSADYPQKDWQRSLAVMRHTGLRHEVFPPRTGGGAARVAGWRTKLKRRVNTRMRRLTGRVPFRVLPIRYVDHRAVVRKYQQYDGCVHVAAEVPGHIDGKYTATLLEAGLTGAILFWHDTFGLGNDLETVFELPLDPEAAAASILAVRDGLDVAGHSRATREEILDRFDPQRSVGHRCRLILEHAG